MTCCSVLQCVASCCSVLQWFVTNLWSIGMGEYVLQRAWHTASCYSVLQWFVTNHWPVGMSGYVCKNSVRDTLQRVAAFRSDLSQILAHWHARGDSPSEKSAGRSPADFWKSVGGTRFFENWQQDSWGTVRAREQRTRPRLSTAKKNTVH